MSLETVQGSVPLDVDPDGPHFAALTGGLDYRKAGFWAEWKFPWLVMPQGFNWASIRLTNNPKGNASRVTLVFQANLCAVVHGPEWTFAGLHPTEVPTAFLSVADAIEDLTGLPCRPEFIKVERVDANVTRAPGSQSAVDQVISATGPVFARKHKGGAKHHTYRSNTTSELLIIRKGLSVIVYDKGQEPAKKGKTEPALRIPSFRIEARHWTKHLRPVESFRGRQGFKFGPSGAFTDHELETVMGTVDEVSDLVERMVAQVTHSRALLYQMAGASLGRAVMLAGIATMLEAGGPTAVLASVPEERRELERRNLSNYRREIDRLEAALPALDADASLSAILNAQTLYARDLKEAGSTAAVA